MEVKTKTLPNYTEVKTVYMVDTVQIGIMNCWFSSKDIDHLIVYLLKIKKKLEKLEKEELR